MICVEVTVASAVEAGWNCTEQDDTPAPTGVRLQVLPSVNTPPEALVKDTCPVGVGEPVTVAVQVCP